MVVVGCRGLSMVVEGCQLADKSICPIHHRGTGERQRPSGLIIVFAQ